DRETVHELLERAAQSATVETGGPQLRCGALEVSDELQLQDVGVVGDRIRRRQSGLPESCHHLELVAGPAVLQQPLAVGRHALDRTTVARLAELATFPVLHVVPEGRGALEA